MHVLTFDERGRALEDQFFQRVDNELRERIRSDLSAERTKDALRIASGIDNDELLTQLVEIGVTPESLAAVTLIPLVVVAWADGKVDDREKRQILLAERDAGLTEDSPCHQMLEHWLAQRPEKNLLAVWKHYVEALYKKLKEPATQLLHEGLRERASAVAQASGGTLGYRNVSQSEQKVLTEIETALKGR